MMSFSRFRSFGFVALLLLGFTAPIVLTPDVGVAQTDKKKKSIFS